MCYYELQLRRSVARLWKTQLNCFSKQDVYLVKEILKTCLRASEKNSESYQSILLALVHFPRPSVTTANDLEVVKLCLDQISSTPSLLSLLDPAIATKEALEHIRLMLISHFSIM
ncbi:MAG: hypothetical protein LLF75_07885 [Eubacteriales bacterium]|nr:hypothetical protein [Eubacteriales bacterium]